MPRSTRRCRPVRGSVRACERRHSDWKETERRVARLAELAAEAIHTAALEDLPAARRQFTVIRREWNDLSAKATPAPDVAAGFADAEAKLSAREAEAREADARARRESLVRINQLVSRVEPLTTAPDLSLKAAERALRDTRDALGHLPPLPSKRDFDEVTRRLKAAQAALTPKVQELRDVEEWQRWANVGIQEQLCEKMEALRSRRETRRRSRGGSAICSSSGGRPPTSRARRASAVAALQGGARRGVGAVRGALRGAGRGARRESRQKKSRSASAPKRWPNRPAGFRPPTRSRRCRRNGRRSVR